MASDRERRARPLVLLVPVAFALGCIPIGKIVLRLLDHGPGTGPEKSGAHAVMQRAGLGPAIAVGALDCAKGYAIGRWARHRGAGRNVVGLLALAPLVSNIFVVRGRGAATAVGSVLAIGEADMAVVALPIVGLSLRHHHALGVMVGALSLPPFRSWRLRRVWAGFWVATIIALIIYARLRGEGNGGDGAERPLTPVVAWSRFWFDRDPAGHDMPETGGSDD